MQRREASKTNHRSIRARKRTRNRTAVMKVSKR